MASPALAMRCATLSLAGLGKTSAGLLLSATRAASTLASNGHTIVHAGGCPCCSGAMAKRQQSSAAAPQPQGSPSDKASQGVPHTYSAGWAAMGKGQPLKLWGRQLPAVLGSEEVEVKVTHNGLCHTDIHMAANDWGITTYPLIAGHEVVGTVTAKGSNVRGVELGSRVGLGWIRDSCRRCPACLRGEENICAKGYTGTIVGGNHGGFQGVVRAPADFWYTIPDAISSEAAAPLLCAGITVYAPLKRYIRPGMSVAILGVGGLGHLGVQFAAHMGGLVTAVDRHADKERECKAFGAKDFVTFEQALSSRKGRFDLMINCVSGHVDTPALMSLLAANGVLVQTGIPGGDIMSVNLQDAVFSQKTVAGSIVGGRSDMESMLALAAAKGIKPLTQTMPLSQVNEAFQYVLDGKARYRVVLTMDKDLTRP